MKGDTLLTDNSSKYKRIIEKMREKITSGRWVVDSVIPSERELAETYGVNRITVRKAIAHLKQRGYLHSEAKRGNYVSPQGSHDSQRLYSFSEDMKLRGGTSGQQILEFGLVPVSEFIRTNLQLPLSWSSILRIKRVRLSDTTPMGIQTSYLALTSDRGINQQELERAGSLYNLLEEKLDIRMMEAYESIGARLPSALEKQYLEIGNDEVVLTSSRVTYSSERIPVEYVEMVYPTSRFTYRMKVSRDTFDY
uniref:GntR family transcriptional regulator n=1 Tax=Yersinia frederiksenii TaxID=29484 RepID=UPI001F4BD66F|nr:GntR family transcriptional regulator [Yersinia frederiksenii]ULG19851.1 GntR family transcriptional regulator [Yersinia frederiksenii]